MEQKISPLLSTYIIDGVSQELTPAQILGGVTVDAESYIGQPGELAGKIVDESLETDAGEYSLEPDNIDKYLTSVLRVKRSLPLVFADSYTRSRIAVTLLETLWRMGHFRIGDLCLDASWKWKFGPLGNAAAFYSSVQAAGEFLDQLGIGLRSYRADDGASACSVEFSAGLRSALEDEGIVERPFTTQEPRIAAASLPSTLQHDPSSWIVYIPFDNSSYRLGGSLLSQALKINLPVAPRVEDPDYFIDCFEVVRELVEDGILLSAATIGDGGLLTALKGMTTPKTGAEIDLSDLKKSVGEEEIVRLLFSEVPGALIQVRDEDFDYIDAELLLQDVAFYPLGHPVSGGHIRVKSSAKTGLQTILDALVRRQGGEGED